MMYNKYQVIDLISSFATGVSICHTNSKESVERKKIALEILESLIISMEKNLL